MCSRVTTCCFVAALLACDPVVDEYINLQITEDAIDVAKQIPGDWSELCILGPYTNDAQASEILGFEHVLAEGGGIAVSDSFSLLLTVNNDRVVGHYRVLREHTDFAPVAGKCYPRSDSNFELISTHNDQNKVRHT